MPSFIARCCVLIVICNVRIVHQSNNEQFISTLSSTEPTSTVYTTPPPPEPTTHPSLDSFDYDVYCKFQPNGYNCYQDAGVPRYYYDMKMETCKTFQYGRCHAYSKNVFESLSSCRETCRDLGPEPISHNLTPNIYCHMQPDFGRCDDYFPMWYYDITKQKCAGFAFSGCGGNQNRFFHKDMCTAVCNGMIPSRPLL